MSLTHDHSLSCPPNELHWVGRTGSEAVSGLDGESLMSAQSCEKQWKSAIILLIN